MLIQKIAQGAGLPSGAHLQVADRCNHACVHCYQVQGRKGEMSLDEVKAVIDDLAASGVMLLNVSGGEATLRPDLLDILRHARSRGFALRLFTNAYTMTPELAAELRRIGLLGVDVSVYSDDPAQHDAVTMVPGSHARTVAGVRAMVAAGLRVHLKVPTTAGVPDAGPRVRRLADEIGGGLTVVTGLDITPMENGDLATRELAPDPDELVALGVLPTWAPGGAEASAEGPSPAQRELDEGLAEPTCGACREGVAVLANGDLRPCTDIVAPLGNLRDRSFRELYASDDTQLVRRLTWADIHGCRDCHLRPACDRCHASAASEGGDLLGPYPSGCRASVARYRGSAGGVRFLAPAEGCEAGRSPEKGPFRIVEPGVLQAIPDTLTAEDLRRRERFPWVKPSREYLEEQSYGQGSERQPRPRRRLPLLSA
jgi:radical SAM protein with 4Fe4S-binding SPASM domain